MSVLAPLSARHICCCRYTNVPNTDSLFCNGAVQTSDGMIAVIGGHIAKSGLLDGLKSLRLYNK